MYRLGFRRLAISIVIALVLLFVLYVITDNLLIPRRNKLFAIEIIIYIVLANIVSCLLLFGSYRLAR